MSCQHVYSNRSCSHFSDLCTDMKASVSAVKGSNSQRAASVQDSEITGTNPKSRDGRALNTYTAFSIYTYILACVNSVLLCSATVYHLMVIKTRVISY